MAQTPDQIAAKWAQNLGQSTQRIQDGVQSVTQAPGLAAAAQKTTWVQNTTSSADKWASNTAKVTLGEWQQAMIEKGLQRVASGATAAEPKFNAFMGRLLPHIDSVKRSLPARGNLDANINRMVAFTRGMAKFQNK
jgi:hypothetical protein